jgi:hypothetical protein
MAVQGVEERLAGLGGSAAGVFGGHVLSFKLWEEFY